MSQAANHLVWDYLAETYPAVAKAFKKEAPTTAAPRRSPFGSKTLAEVVVAHRVEKRKRAAADYSDSEDDKGPVKKAASRKAPPKLTVKKVPIPDSSDSDDDEEPLKKAASRKAPPKPAVKKAAIPDSSDDDEPVKKPAAKKASPKSSPKTAPKKAAVMDSDSDEGSLVKKPASRKASPKLTVKKAPIPDSSDSDEDEAPVVKKPVAAVKTSLKAAPKRAAMDSDSDDEGLMSAPARKAAKPEAGARRGPQNLNEDGTFRRFQRIDPTKVTFHAEALKDNRPGDEHLVLRQNQDMMRTKGKGFNKLKQKNKGKFYGAGVDLSVRAYQFPDSDDE